MLPLARPRPMDPIYTLGLEELIALHMDAQRADAIGRSARRMLASLLRGRFVAVDRYYFRTPAC